MSRRFIFAFALFTACSPSSSHEDASPKVAPPACAARGTYDATKLPARNPAYARIPVTGNRLALAGYGFGNPAIGAFATAIETNPLTFTGSLYRRTMLSGLGIANFRMLTFPAGLTPMAAPSFPGPFANQAINPPSAIINAYSTANPTAGVQLRTIKEYVDSYRKAANGQGGMPVTDVATELIAYANADATAMDRRNMLVWHAATDPMRVQAEASASEQRYANEAAGRQPGPRALEGVFVVVKDQIDVGTVATGLGTRWRAAVTPAADATVVANLRAQGAIVLAKSNMSEIGGNITGYNPTTGPARNAYDRTKVGGGSSGGSAIAVATGLVPVAIGADAGGSIRIPASANGVYGLKPTYGRMSQMGVYPLAESLSQPGPMANTPGDLAAIYIAMAGAPNDCKFGSNGGGLGLGVDLGNYWGAGLPLQIGVYNGWNSQAAPAIQTPVGNAIARLVALGAVQRQIDPANSGIPKLEWALVAQLMTYATSARTSVTGDAAYRQNQATAEQRITVSMGQTVATNVTPPTNLSSCNYVVGQPPCDVQRAQLIRAELGQALDKLFCDAGVDVIATFTVGQAMPPVRDAAGTPNGGSASPDGETDLREMEGLGLTNALANLSGHPAITIPVGYVGGMPVGLQLIGREWSECDLMNIAQVYDRFTRTQPQTTYDPLTPMCSCAAGGECETAVCDGDGSCVQDFVADGTACSIGTCQEGTCTAPCSCNDGNECTADSCSGKSCSFAPLPTTTSCLDGGGACDGNGTCVPFECGSCDDGNACTADSCDAYGCVAMPDPDGTWCPGGTCVDATCTGSGPPGDAGVSDAPWLLDAPADASWLLDAPAKDASWNLDAPALSDAPWWMPDAGVGSGSGSAVAM